jgi:hypothetical protein
VVLAVDDFFFEFFVEFLSIFLDHFFKVQNLLLFEDQLIFIVLFQGTYVGVTELTELDFEGFRLLIV